MGDAELKGLGLRKRGIVSGKARGKRREGEGRDWTEGERIQKGNRRGRERFFSFISFFVFGPVR